MILTWWVSALGAQCAAAASQSCISRLWRAGRSWRCPSWVWRWWSPGWTDRWSPSAWMSLCCRRRRDQWVFRTYIISTSGLQADKSHLISFFSSSSALWFSPGLILALKRRYLRASVELCFFWSRNLFIFSSSSFKENCRGAVLLCMEVGASTVISDSEEASALCSVGWSSVLARFASGLRVTSPVELHSSVFSSGSSETASWQLSNVSLDSSSFTLGSAGHRLSGVSMATSQSDETASLSESASVDVAPYLNPSSTDLPPEEPLLRTFGGFRGDFTLGLKVGDLTAPFKKDWSVFCVGPLFAALATFDLCPQLELWWLEKAALRPARFSDDFGLWMTGSSSESGMFSSDGIERRNSDAVESRVKDSTGSQWYYSAVILIFYTVINSLMISSYWCWAWVCSSG